MQLITGKEQGGSMNESMFGLVYSCQVSLSVTTLLAFWQSYFRVAKEIDVRPILDRTHRRRKGTNIAIVRSLRKNNH